VAPLPPVAAPVAVALPEKLTLFGITLGSALNADDARAARYICDTTLSKTQSLDFMKSYDHVPKPGMDFCLFFAPGEAREGVVIEGELNFREQLPVGFLDLKLDVRRDTGRINSMEARTMPDFSQAIFAMLVQKFGQPQGDPIVHMQNGYGAKFDKYLAIWKFQDGGELTFDSGTGIPSDAGFLTATAGAVVKERDERRAAEKTNERGL